eukprot:5377460-Amphidinium_carterae.2
MRKVIVESPSTAPGPDGVTYAMVAASGTWGVRFMTTVLCAVLTSADLPCSWTESHVVFLPKSSGCSLAPDQWRPLSLANVCFKILQAYVLTWLTPLSIHLHPSQFGFLHERYLVQALRALERAALRASGLHPYSAVLFCDLRNAYGSIYRGFLRAVHVAMNIPPMLLAFVDAVLKPSLGHVSRLRVCLHGTSSPCHRPDSQTFEVRDHAYWFCQL